MSVRHITYLDLSPEKRHEHAERVRAGLRATLGSPFTSPEQQATLLKQLEHINQWEQGKLPGHDAPKPKNKP